MEGFSEYHRKSLSAVKEGGEEYLIESIHASFHGDFHCCL